MNVKVTRRRSEAQAVDFQFIRPKEISLNELVEDLRKLDAEQFSAVIKTAKKIRRSDNMYVKALTQIEEV